MRLFIAIDLDNEIKDTLNHSIQDLKRNSVSGNFTPRENLHLTVVFIGETMKTKEVNDALERATANINANKFNLSIEGMGKFKRREGDIYWVGINKEQNLWSIQGEITKELKKAGFDIEDRDYVPHLTLGRKVITKETFNEQDFKKSLGKMDMEVKKISLMKSERVGNRQVYTEIFKVDL